MSKDELIDEHVSLKQCRLAVDALHSHETKKQESAQEKELLPSKEPNIWLNVTVKKIPSGHKFKPLKVPIDHPLVDPRTTPVCLITKDPQRQYKDLLENNNIKFISRVVGIEKLKGKFKPYEARRALLKENGLFLADDRVIPLLPKLLGRKWFEAKKQPIPVCLTRKDLKGELERAISSTYMNQNQGTCTSVKIATLSHKPSQVVANIQKALPTIVNHINGGWENIQNLNIKTNSSVSLPIWSCNLDDGTEGRWHGFTAVEEAEEEEEFTGVSSYIDVDAPKPNSTGRKRASKSESESEDEDNKPRKKAKPAKDSIGSSKPSEPRPLLPTASSSTKTVKAVPQPAPSAKTQRKVVVDDANSKSNSSVLSKAAKAVKPEGSDVDKNKRQVRTSVDGKAPKRPAAQVDNTRSLAKTSTESPIDAVPSRSTESDTPSAKKSGKKAKSAATAATQAASSPSKSPAAGFKHAGKKATGKKSISTDASTTTSSTEKPNLVVLTQDDLKSKRSVGERKKEKIVKAKGGKSVKNAILGKKVAQA